MRSFGELSGLHAELDELFLEHQRALIGFDPERALALLTDYESLLAEHIREEEELLLPVYEPIYQRNAAQLRGGAPEIFYGEHRKLREFVAHFKAQVPRIRDLPDPVRALIKLLDTEATFKHLVEHHHTREEKILYTELDRATSPEERDKLLARLTLTHP